MNGFDDSFNRILDLSQNKFIQNFVKESRNLYNKLLNESVTGDPDIILRAKRLLDVAVLIYVTEKEVCNNTNTTYVEYGMNGSNDLDEIIEGTFCHANMRRVLESIKRYTVVKGSLTLDTNLATAIRDAIMTCNYYTKHTQFVPSVFTKLAELKKSNKPLFEKYVDEILKVEVSPENPEDFKIVLHSGFKKAWMLGFGPSLKSTDEDGVFICELRFHIKNFLIYYGIKYTESKRFGESNSDCASILTNRNMSKKPSSGGKSSRRRKAYKTTRRNNKNKNKKQYRRKRHTKKYKKSHRRSRR